MKANTLTIILGAFALSLLGLIMTSSSSHKQPSFPPLITPVPSLPQPIPAPQLNPGDNVVWTEFRPLKNLSDPSWGNVLTDIENHLPPSMGTQYRHPDKNTWAHETTHGINSHLNMQHKRNNNNVYGLYALNNKAVLIPQPKLRIAQIAEMVPSTLRKSRYQLYLVQQRRDWDNDPIYLYDEWIAYVNGAACSVELHQKGLLKDSASKSDVLWSVVEFNVYAFYVCMAAQKYDPGYNTKQLLEFTAWNTRRGMDIYNAGMKFAPLNWDNDKYLQELRTSSGAQEMRQYIIKTFGATWAKEVMGF